jgi:hypothetical protein
MSGAKLMHSSITTHILFRLHRFLSSLRIQILLDTYLDKAPATLHQHLTSERCSARYLKEDLRLLCIKRWELGFSSLGAAGGGGCRHLERSIAAVRLIRIEVKFRERELVLVNLIYQKVDQATTRLA